MPRHLKSTFDQVYRSFLLSKFFTKGWGSQESIKRCFEYIKFFSNREHCLKLLNQYENPVEIQKETKEDGLQTFYGRMKSPLASIVPELVSPPVGDAAFKIVLPSKWRYDGYRPVCIHLAATGDHYFWRRHNLMAKPLARENGIGSVILENPFYGCRKPKEQTRSSLQNVTDLFVMGGCLIMECLALLRWAEQLSYGPFCLTGISLGGHMASLAATNWPKPVALVPCLSWSTASCVFTQGALSGAIPWKLLEQQYDQYERDGFFNEIPQHIIENTNAFMVGQQFAKDMSSEQIGETAVIEQKKQFAWNTGSTSRVLEVVLPKSLPFTNRRATRRGEVVQFMNGLMDEFTHLQNFSKPVDCNLIIAIEASHDGYVPRDKVTDLSEIWPEAEVRYIENRGHVQGILFHHSLFRSTIVEAFDRIVQKYY